MNAFLAGVIVPTTDSTANSVANIGISVLAMISFAVLIGFCIYLQSKLQKKITEEGYSVVYGEISDPVTSVEFKSGIRYTYTLSYDKYRKTVEVTSKLKPGKRRRMYLSDSGDLMPYKEYFSGIAIFSAVLIGLIWMTFFR